MEEGWRCANEQLPNFLWDGSGRFKIDGGGRLLAMGGSVLAYVFA
jgi:hypothetical protein